MSPLNANADSPGSEPPRKRPSIDGEAVILAVRRHNGNSPASSASPGSDGNSDGHPDRQTTQVEFTVIDGQIVNAVEIDDEVRPVIILVELHKYLCMPGLLSFEWPLFCNQGPPEIYRIQ